MPISGAKPKPAGTTRHRNRIVHDWVEVENVPYVGDVPVVLPDGMRPEVQRWWEAITQMPHCKLWTQTDWEFALASAEVCDAFWADPLKGEKALRDREKVLGTTLDYRRNLRIRYIDPEPVTATSEVSSIADYRALAASHQSSEATA